MVAGGVVCCSIIVFVFLAVERGVFMLLILSEVRFFRTFCRQGYVDAEGRSFFLSFFLSLIFCVYLIVNCYTYI